MLDGVKSVGRKIKRLLPGGRSEHLVWLLGIKILVESFGYALAPDHWLGKPLWMTDIIKTIATLYTEPSLIGRPITSRHILDLVIFNVIGQ